MHDVDHLREQLFEHVSYAGVADTTVTMDATTRMMCSNYMAALNQLALADLRRGRVDDALATLRFLETHTPPARLGPDAIVFAGALRQQIQAEAARARQKSAN